MCSLFIRFCVFFIQCLAFFIWLCGFVIRFYPLPLCAIFIRSCTLLIQLCVLVNCLCAPLIWLCDFLLCALFIRLYALFIWLCALFIWLCVLLIWLCTLLIWLCGFSPLHNMVLHYVSFVFVAAYCCILNPRTRFDHMLSSVVFRDQRSRIQLSEIIFSRKTSQRNHPGLMFNNIIVNVTSIYKHLTKTVGLLRKFQGILPRTSLITIYKLFARPHLDYGDKIYDQTFNESFHQRIESIQYNVAIAITGAIRGTSSEKLCQELGLESLRSGRWLRKLCLCYKIYKNKSPSYLYNLIPDRVMYYSTRSSQIDNIPNIKTRSNFFRYSFFLLQ